MKVIKLKLQPYSKDDRFPFSNRQIAKYFHSLYKEGNFDQNESDQVDINNKVKDISENTDDDDEQEEEEFKYKQRKR